MIDCLEFDCCDCGSRVYQMSLAPDAQPPVPPRCATCLWIATYIDPADYTQVREFLRHGESQ